MLQKRGLAATGILAGMSKAAGFSSVSDLLQKNPDAKRPPSAPLDPIQPTVSPRHNVTVPTVSASFSVKDQQAKKMLGPQEGTSLVHEKCLCSQAASALHVLVL